MKTWEAFYQGFSGNLRVRSDILYSVIPFLTHDLPLTDEMQSSVVEKTDFTQQEFKDLFSVKGKKKLFSCDVFNFPGVYNDCEAAEYCHSSFASGFRI